jgi:peptidoglycan-N-acetylglucosamine deacetylase
MLRRFSAIALAAIAALTAWPLSAAPRTLYLTFDADMTPGMLRRLRAGEVASWYDPAILDFLRERRVPAVVFVTGLFAETYPDLVRRLAGDPLFAVGVHGYRHAAYTPHCYGLAALATDAEKRDDLRKAREAVSRVAGREPSLFRYPGLCHDAHDDELVRQEGLRVDDPDVIAGDSFNRNAGAIVEQVLRQAKDGGTVIFHLGGPNAPASLEALKKVVPLLEKRGYVFASKR